MTHRRRMTKINRAMLAALAAAAAMASSHALAEPLPAPGALLHQGEWGGSAGSFSAPDAFRGLTAKQWPMDNWAVLMLDKRAATMTIRPLALAQARKRLKPITDEIIRSETPGMEEDTHQTSEAAAADLYVRVPGVDWKAGSVPVQRFKNGGTTLRPELGHRFEMKLGDKPYAFSVQNGLRTADGRPYGSGAQFTLEVDGERFEYDLGGNGWDARLNALGDFDGDGRPDFLFVIGDNNSGHEALVLSSRAKPGKNPPTAYLTAMGC